MEKSLRHLYQFGPYRLDSSECLLLRNGQAVSLTPKAFDLLKALVERPGELLSKEDLLQTVCLESLVEKINLADNIWKLLRLFGEGKMETGSLKLCQNEGTGSYVMFESYPMLRRMLISSLRH